MCAFMQLLLQYLRTDCDLKYYVSFIIIHCSQLLPNNLSGLSMWLTLPSSLKFIMDLKYFVKKPQLPPQQAKKTNGRSILTLASLFSRLYQSISQLLHTQQSWEEPIIEWSWTILTGEWGYIHKMPGLIRLQVYYHLSPRVVTVLYCVSAVATLNCCATCYDIIIW